MANKIIYIQCKIGNDKTTAKVCIPFIYRYIDVNGNIKDKAPFLILVYTD
jgi:hypothetical protein